MKIRLLSTLICLFVFTCLVSCGREPTPGLPQDSLPQDFPTQVSDVQPTQAPPADGESLPLETQPVGEQLIPASTQEIPTPEPPPETLPTSEHPVDSLPPIFDLPVSTGEPETSLMRTSVLTQTAVQVAAGERFACVLTHLNEVKCWGNNQYGQLGYGQSGQCSYSGPPQPSLPVTGLYSTIKSIDAGWYHACASTDNGLMCWGRNNTGQLGDGTRENRCEAVYVNGLDEVDAYALGGYHSCAIQDNRVKCWGDGYRGQLGNGSSGTGAYSPSPIEVSGLEGVVGITAGAWHTCVLMYDGGVRCWGDNSYGQSGDGLGDYGVYTTTPVQVIGLNSGVKAIAAGGNHTCALMNDNSVRCWGDNDYGQMGIGVYGGYYSNPVIVNGFRNIFVDEIEAGGSHTCVRTRHRGVLCWGFNYYGQVGNGGVYQYVMTPSNVLDLDCGVSDITAGDFFSCAALDNGSLKCWGRNSDGQLGDGGWDHQYQPHDVVGFEEDSIYKICGYVLDKNNPKKQYFGVDISTTLLRKVTTDPENWWRETGTLNYHTGGFCFCRVEPALYTLLANRTGLKFGPDVVSVDVPPNQDDGTLVIEAEPLQTFALSGRILDAMGNPIEGVKIISSSGDSTYSTVGGYYTLSLEAGTQTIEPSKGGYTFNPVSVTLDLQEDKTEDFEAIPPPPTSRGSQSFTGGQANGSSDDPSLSGDGRFVAFSSSATNLVEDDNNVSCNYIGYGYPLSNCNDVFVFDRQLGKTTLVSVSSNGVQGNMASESPSISANGRFVVFWSDANNLVENDTNNVPDVFVRDLLTGLTRRVSVASDGTQMIGIPGSIVTGGPGPSISDDGRFIVFSHKAANLVPGDTNEKSDIFVHDLETGETLRVSVTSAGQQVYGDSRHPVISGNGRYVVFVSDSIHLVSGDTNGYRDIFVHDMQTGETTLVSEASNGTQTNSDSYDPVISADGRYVVFASMANNLMGDVTSFQLRIFVRDRQTGQTTRLPVGSFWPSISADGRYIGFSSEASNLVSGDTNKMRDDFVYDLQTGEISLVSMSSEGVQGNENVDEGERLPMSVDGSIVAYTSAATNLVPGDIGYGDVFVAEWPSLPVLIATEPVIPTPTAGAALEQTEKVYLPIVLRK